MSQNELGELYRLIRDLTDKVSVLAVVVARVEERIKATEDLQARVSGLEMSRAQLQGVGIAAKAFWAFIGAGGVGVVVGVVEILKKVP